MAILTDEFGVFLTDEFGQYITDEDGMPSLTGDILLVDGVSDLLLSDGASAALLSGGAGNTGTCRILKTDASSDLLLANGSDHLLLFDCVPATPGNGCLILKTDGTSAVLLANGVDHLLLFDCVPAVVTPPPSTETIRPGGLSSSTKRTHRPVYVDAFSRIKRQTVEEPKVVEPKPEAKPAGVPFAAALSHLGQQQANYAEVVAQMQREAQQAARLLKRKQDDEAIALLLLS